MPPGTVHNHHVSRDGLMSKCRYECTFGGTRHEGQRSPQLQGGSDDHELGERRKRIRCREQQVKVARCDGHDRHETGTDGYVRAAELLSAPTPHNPLAIVPRPSNDTTTYFLSDSGTSAISAMPLSW